MKIGEIGRIAVWGSPAEWLFVNTSPDTETIIKLCKYHISHNRWLHHQNQWANKIWSQEIKNIIYQKWNHISLSLSCYFAPSKLNKVHKISSRDSFCQWEPQKKCLMLLTVWPAQLRFRKSSRISKPSSMSTPQSNSSSNWSLTSSPQSKLLLMDAELLVKKLSITLTKSRESSQVESFCYHREIIPTWCRQSPLRPQKGCRPRRVRL
jgi:hypothetical protein